MVPEWVDELRASLLRAGDHIASPSLIYPIGDREHFVFRLHHSIPIEARDAVRSYIQLYAKEKGWIAKAKIKVLLIEFEVLGPYVPTASRRSEEHKRRYR